MPKFATETSVSVVSSQAEIMKVLGRYGATRFAYAQEEDRAAILFDHQGLRIRFSLPLPRRDADEFRYRKSNQHSGSRTLRPVNQVEAAWEQACRQRWRALVLAIKAKLEAVECGIATFEHEFLAYIVMPDNRTVAEHVVPKVQEAYKTNTMPPLLGLGT